MLRKNSDWDYSHNLINDLLLHFQSRSPRSEARERLQHMNKFLIFVLAFTIGFWIYMRPNQAQESWQTVKLWCANLIGPPEGIYFLTDRVGVPTQSGIRSVAKGTEVKLISKTGSTAVVDDGRGKFTVDLAKLTRDFEMRAESHLGEHADANGPGPGNLPAKTKEDLASLSEPRRALAIRIALVDDQLLELMDKLRAMSTNDPIQGRSIADREAASVIQQKIDQLKLDRSKS